MLTSGCIFNCSGLLTQPTHVRLCDPAVLLSMMAITSFSKVKMILCKENLRGCKQVHLFKSQTVTKKKLVVYK